MPSAPLIVADAWRRSASIMNCFRASDQPNEKLASTPVLVCEARNARDGKLLAGETRTNDVMTGRVVSSNTLRTCFQAIRDTASSVIEHAVKNRRYCCNSLVFFFYIVLEKLLSFSNNCTNSSTCENIKKIFFHGLIS